MRKLIPALIGAMAIATATVASAQTPRTEPTMKIIAIAVPRPGMATPEKTAPHQVAEANATWDLYQQGFIREMYFRDDQPGAVVIVEAANVEEARTRLNSLPMVRAGVMDFQFIPLKPFPVFANLFGAQAGERRLNPNNP